MPLTALQTRRYVRSEGIAAIVLQRSGMTDVPRWAAVTPYCTIKNIGINNDGFTKEGITFPSKNAQLALEKQVRPSPAFPSLSYPRSPPIFLPPHMATPALE